MHCTMKLHMIIELFCYKYLHSMLFHVISMFCLMCISFLRKSPDHSKETLLIIHVSIKSDEVVLGMTRTWYETDQLVHNDDMWNLILNMKLQAKEFYEKLQCWYIIKYLQSQNECVENSRELKITCTAIANIPCKFKICYFVIQLVFVFTNSSRCVCN